MLPGLLSVVIEEGVISVPIDGVIAVSGVFKAVRKGDLLVALLVLKKLLSRLRCGVSLRLYSEFFSFLVNRSYETKTVNL